MIAGTKVKIGEKEYVLPSLSLGQLRKGVSAKIKQNDELVQKEEYWEAAVVKAEIICDALSRNYPDLNREEIIDNIDLRNVNNLWLICLGNSSLDVGEASQDKGDPTTSGPSTPPSPGLTDGP